MDIYGMVARMNNTEMKDMFEACMDNMLEEQIIESIIHKLDDIWLDELAANIEDRERAA